MITRSDINVQLYCMGNHTISRANWHKSGRNWLFAKKFVIERLYFLQARYHFNHVNKGT